MNMGQVSREVKRVNRGWQRFYTLNKVDGTIITPEEILNRITGFPDGEVTKLNS